MTAVHSNTGIHPSHEPTTHVYLSRNGANITHWKTRVACHTQGKWII